MTALLFALAVFDELVSGVSTVGAPDIHSSFPTSYAGLAVVLMLVPGVASLVLEPPLFLLADRWPRHWFIAGGCAAMAAGMTVVALAPSAWVLAAGLSLLWVGGGVAINLAQATLVDLHADRRASMLARWSLLGLAGDLAAPALLVAVTALGLSWRAAFGVLAVVVAVWALALARRPLARPPVTDGDRPTPSLWAALARALRHRRLVIWMFGTALCDLLDEIMVVLASLHLRHGLAASPAWTGAVVAAFAGGGALGLVIVERVTHRMAASRLLALCAGACALAFVAWLAAPTVETSAALALLVGATTAPLYPLACAQTYAALPGGSGAVLAAGHLVTPISLALPWVLGAIADRFGVVAALVVLIAQPIGLGLLALIAPIDDQPRNDKPPASRETRR